jgi:membrane-associated phospholipid phosphatase
METVTFLQRFASPALDTAFQALSALGSTNAYIVLLLSVYLALDSRLGTRLGIFVLVGFYLNFHLKGLLDAPRPFELEPALGRTPEALGHSGPGFPSAHAQLSLTFWGYLAWWCRRRYLWVVAAVLVALISLSRLYLGMHFPVDVLGGLAIGLLYTAVAALAEPLWPSLKRIPRTLRVGLGLLVPLFLMVLLPPPGQEPDLILGALAAFLTAPLLAAYTPPPALWRRLLVALAGVALVFALLSASSLLLPEAVKRDPLGGFARYLLIAYGGLWLTPRLAQRLGLAPRPAPRDLSQHAPH